jgi:catechol 2,3-dioxygenase-like lactoylglutathione lyase family enzyme
MARKITEIALFVSNVKSARDFYKKIFDSEPSFSSDDVALFELDGLKVLIHKKSERPSHEKLRDEDHFALDVASVDEVYNELTKKELQFWVEPEDFDWGRSAYLRDPEGRLVEFHQAKK